MWKCLCFHTCPEDEGWAAFNALGNQRDGPGMVSLLIGYNKANSWGRKYGMEYLGSYRCRRDTKQKPRIEGDKEEAETGEHSGAGR